MVLRLSYIFKGKAILYIDGEQNGPTRDMGANAIISNQFFVGFDGYHHVHCECDLAELAVYSRVLGPEEMRGLYSRYVQGPDCPYT